MNAIFQNHIVNMTKAFETVSSTNYVIETGAEEMTEAFETGSATNYKLNIVFWQTEMSPCIATF